MRVLYLLSSNVMGGASISFLNLILSFDKRDITPVVVFPNKVTDSEFENVLKLNGIEFHHSNLVESVMQKPCMNNIVRWVAKYLYLSIKKRKSRKELSSIINRVNPDIIHTNVGTIHDRLSTMGSKLLMETLPSIFEGTNERITKFFFQKSTFSQGAFF